MTVWESREGKRNGQKIWRQVEDMRQMIQKKESRDGKKIKRKIKKY